MLKVCKCCGKKKSISNFRKSKKYEDNLYIACKDCKGYENPYSDSNSKKYRKTASIKFRKKNFELHMLLATKSSAKKRNLDFDLTIEDIVIPEYCPYLGTSLTRFIGKGRSTSNPSVDRIDNNKGYVKGNIEIISDLANSMKRECSQETLLVFAHSIIQKYSK